MYKECSRRQLLHDTFAAGSVLAAASAGFAIPQAFADKKHSEPEVTATEDLMREHGVIRRALLVYAETVPKLRTKPDSGTPPASDALPNCSAHSGRTIREDAGGAAYVPTVRKMNANLAQYAPTF